MNVLLTCGGSGGHINPALAIAGELRRRDPDAGILFIGADREMEKRLIPAAGYRLENVEMAGFVRSVSPKAFAENANTLRLIAQAKRKVRRLIGEFKPDVAVGTGGYVCYPVLKTASRCGVPTVVHESNSIPGLTTKLLQPTLDRILVAFPGSERHYAVKSKVVLTGTPVRGDFITATKAGARTALGLGNRPVVVSIWGSLGASKMNEYMADFIAENARTGAFHHIHATGGGAEGKARMLEMLKARGLETLPENVDLREYIYDMGQVMNAADLVLCRAGASTLAELTALGKPSVLVPSPNVTNHHQERNAEAMEQAGASVMIREENCSGTVLLDTVLSLISDEDRLERMSESAGKLGVPDSAQRIADLLEELANA